MIKMKSPSLVINSHDVPGPNYRMWETINASEGMTVTMLVNEIIRVYRITLEDNEGLYNIIINCHGWDGGGGLSIGGMGKEALTTRNAPYFSLLKTRRIGTIWLVACQAAKGNSGKELCRAIAYHSSSLVVASDEDQSVGIWGGYNVWYGRAFNAHHIDEYEGTVFGFYPNGMMNVIDPHDVQTILD